jgi:signal transduction histidine kinase
MLRVAQLDSGDQEDLEDVSAADIVAAALIESGTAATTSVMIDPDIPPFPAVSSRLSRALANVLDNAQKFGPATEKVELVVSRCLLSRPGGAAAGVVFAVFDRGPGLAEEDTERAFAPFEQGGDPLTGKPAGVGLGLYEAQAIARRHGGDLLYHPREGGGSEFRISVCAETAAAWNVNEARRA